MPPGRNQNSLEVLYIPSDLGCLLGGTRTHWSDYISHLTWERRGAGEGLWGEGCPGFPAEPVGSETRPQIRGR